MHLKISTKMVARLIILIWIMIFTHSELGFCPEKGHNKEHDYCSIIEGAITQINKQVTVKQLDIKTVCLLSEKTKADYEKYLVTSISLALPECDISNDIYIHNNSFLI